MGYLPYQQVLSWIFSHQHRGVEVRGFVQRLVDICGDPMAVKVGNDGGKGSEWVRMGTAECFPINCEVCTVCMCSNDGCKVDVRW